MKAIVKLYALLLVLLFTSCNGELDRFRKEIDNVNSRCPIDMGMIGRLTSVSLTDDDKNVNWTIELSEPILIDLLKNMDAQECKEMWFMNAPSLESGQLFEKMTELGLGASWTYEYGADKYTFTLSADELKQAIENPEDPKEAARKMLKYSIKIYNKVLPAQVDEITVMDKVKIKGGNVVYFMTVDDTGFEIDAETMSHGAASKAMLEELLKDKSFKQFINVVYKSGMGLTYFYQFKNSDLEEYMTFSNAELGLMLK